MDPTGYEDNLGHWIKRYQMLATQEMEATLKPHGLGRTQWYILFCINQADKLSQRALQQRLNIESATLTSLVATLTRKGWITQTLSPLDRRSKILSLTPSGQTRWQTLPDPITAVKHKALRGITQADIEQAKAVLQTAVKNLETKEEM